MLPCRATLHHLAMIVATRFVGWLSGRNREITHNYGTGLRHKTVKQWLLQSETGVGVKVGKHLSEEIEFILTFKHNVHQAF
jgi:hypothetical protein